MLTAEEKAEAKKGQVSFIVEGVRLIYWGIKGKGKSPDMRVAQVRGIPFELMVDNAWDPRCDDDSDYQVLQEMAEWLDYPDIDEYNKACEQRPREVYKRLREAV